VTVGMGVGVVIEAEKGNVGKEVVAFAGAD
jgi:hypothetical protein